MNFVEVLQSELDATGFVIDDLEGQLAPLYERQDLLRKTIAHYSAELNIKSLSKRAVSTNGESSSESGPQAQASHAGIGTETLAGQERHISEGDRQPEKVERSPDNIVLVDATTLRPITEKQNQAFEGLKRAAAKINRPTLAEITEEGGFESSGAIAYLLDGLRQAGYARNFGRPGLPDWRPLAKGEARVGGGARSRSWSVDELDELRNLDPNKGDSYDAFSAKIKRTGTACAQKARTMGCYRYELEYGQPSLGRHPEKPVTPSVPAVVAQRQERKPTPPPERLTNVTSQLLGDPETGRGAADRLDMKTYLLRKGHTVATASKGFIVDGRLMQRWEALEIVNRHRAKSDLAPLMLEQVQ